MRIIKSTENSSGNLTDAQIKFMWEYNTHPVFNRKEKAWVLVRVPKSTTRNVAWHIRVDDVNYQALQMSAGGNRVKIFYADAKGKPLNLHSVMKEYVNYVDLESAVDLFYEETHQI